MKTIILGGFLGSGKTTVLLQFAKYLVEQNPINETGVVILENEIGNENIDGQLLESENFTVENIFSGCICCTMAGHLSTTVQKLQSLYQPEYLIIEATGLAHPDLVKQALLAETGVQADILDIVDSKRWSVLTKAFPDFVKSQLNECTMVLINKIDQISDAEQESVLKSVLDYARTPLIFPVSALQKIDVKIWHQFLN